MTTPILAYRQLSFPCILTWLKGQGSSLGFILKDTKQRHHFNNKNQSYGFSNSQVWMSELDCKEGSVPKNWRFRTVVLEKTLENPLDCKEIKPVNPRGNQPWKFAGRTDAEAEAPILWPPDAKSWLTAKDSDAGEDWEQEEEGATEEEIVGWPHRLNGHEFEQILGDSEGQGSLACYSPWYHKGSDMTEWLNNNKNKIKYSSETEINKPL